MKNRIILLMSIFTAICINVQSLAAENTIDELNQLKWKNRILLIKPKLACDQEAPSLIADEIEINDRDIIWFVFCDQKVESNHPGVISDKFITSTINSLFIRDDVTIILVGKDGGVKRRTDKLELTRLYELIDSMPMRQNEMQH